MFDRAQEAEIADDAARIASDGARDENPADAKVEGFGLGRFAELVNEVRLARRRLSEERELVAAD